MLVFLCDGLLVSGSLASRKLKLDSVNWEFSLACLVNLWKMKRNISRLARRNKNKVSELKILSLIIYNFTAIIVDPISLECGGEGGGGGGSVSI